MNFNVCNMAFHDHPISKFTLYLLLLCTSLYAQLISALHQVSYIGFMFYGQRLSFNHIMCFVLPKSVWNLLKINSCFLKFLRLFYIFITGNKYIIWTKYAFSTENVVVVFTTTKKSQIMMNTETPLP
jgi:hypothetical protein